MDRVAAHLVVRGFVQGVGFRAHVVEAARAAGAFGWVRNVPDGTVEVHVEGDPDAVERVVAACGRGPRSARVGQVQRSDAVPEGADRFTQR